MRQTIAIVTSAVLVADNDCSITVESFLIVKVNVRGQPNFSWFVGTLFRG